MTDIKTLIGDTERLLAAATQGELRLDPVASLMHHPMFALRAGPDGIRSCIVACELTEGDARLFAHTPSALRSLVKEVQGLQHSLADAMLQIDAIQGSNAVHMSRVAELTQTLEEVQEALLVAKASVTELEAAAKVRPIDDAPKDGTDIAGLCRVTCSWSVKLKMWWVEQSTSMSPEYFVPPDQRGKVE